MPSLVRRDNVKVSTKAGPWQAGGLSPEGVRNQFEGSLKRLQLDRVDIFYLHAPDHKVEILETLAVVSELHRAKKFKRFGLSNYAAWQVVEIYHLCKERAWVLPTVYQGMYNCITRAVEPELFPVRSLGSSQFSSRLTCGSHKALRRLGIHFYAYNITAGGLLAGDPEHSARFNTSLHAERYKPRYINEPYLKAMKELRAACLQEAIDPVAAALRWLVHHSKLQPNDMLIVGASKVAHLSANLDAILKGGPLPDSVVSAMNAAALTSKPNWPQYNR